MPKYRKLPIEVEAILFDGTVDPVIKWAQSLGKSPTECVMGPYMGHGLKIQTRDGDMIASPGDYIIQEPFPTDDRLFYPCKPDIFEATYTPAD